jgi:hypothetical protein
MTRNDQADRRPAPTFGKLKARQPVRFKREVARNNHAIARKAFVIDTSR